jgi:probable phosphomutase (TIGR03848 family)
MHAGARSTLTRVSTVVLVRHGRTSANATGILAGWTPGVELDETGIAQANSLRERLAALPLTAVVASPLDRTVQTARLMLGDRDVPVHLEERVGECRYGDWTGRPLKELVKEPLWRIIQAHPSAVTFPGVEGESMPQMQYRAVTAVREWNERLGPDAVYAVVSHGDVIKAVLADALGLHLDQFQRLHVDPCSVSVVQYTPMRPFVERTNDVGGDLSRLAPSPKRRSRRRSSDAVVGGGAGR